MMLTRSNQWGNSKKGGVFPLPNNTLVIVLLLLITAIPPGALAQCDGSTCETCLAGFNCVWNPAANNGTGICQEQCSDFPNVDCYYARTFGEGSTTAQVCDAAANKVDENIACFALDTAEKCLQRTGCDWINGRIENAEVRNWCALDVDYVPTAAPCSANNCTGCLEDKTNPNLQCIWMPSTNSCTSSCDNFPNVDCYYSKMFGLTADAEGTNTAICNAANNSVLENEGCFNETNQNDCFSVSGCGWIPTDASDPSNIGFCTLYLADGGGGGSGCRPTLLLVSTVGLLAFSWVATWFATL